MTTPKLTSYKKTQTLEFISYDDEQQGSNYLQEADAIDDTGKPMNQQSITDLPINSEVLLYQGE